MRISFYIFLIVYFFSFSSCLQDELPIQNPNKPISTQIHLGVDYDYQIFFNLQNNQIVSQNLKTEWDLGFEASFNGWRIILNSSNFMKVAELTGILFEDLNSEVGLTWKYDNSIGISEETAIGDYRNKNNFYVVDLGVDKDGSSFGYKKIEIDTVTNYFFRIRSANLDNTNDTLIEINKDNDFNFVYLSLLTNSILEIEPIKDAWDLLFTRYTTKLISGNDTIPYGVTGVLINYLADTEVALDTISNFSNIDYDMIGNYYFSNHQDAIGYDWKAYDGQYTVNPEKNYIIKNIQDNYFKLRFIDFYDENGLKGSPKFEVQKL